VVQLGSPAGGDLILLFFIFTKYGQRAPLSVRGARAAAVSGAAWARVSEMGS